MWGGIMKLNKLHLINEAIKEFDNTPSTKNFALKYKNDKRQMFVDLFEDKIYRQLKLKKSGLLILSAYYTHLIDDKDLSENSDKIVLPIDVVICSIFSYVLPKKYEKIIMSNSDELKKALTKY